MLILTLMDLIINITKAMSNIKIEDICGDICLIPIEIVM